MQNSKVKYELYTRVKLDRETDQGNPSKVQALLICEDGVDSSLGEMSIRHTSTLSAEIIILDENDNRPRLQTNYNITVKENNALGQEIATVSSRLN